MITHIDPSIIRTFLILAFLAGTTLGGLLGWKIRGIAEDMEDGKGILAIFNKLKRKAQSR